ncbi:helix-turn-helix domain-containing protein [Nocardiopsis oceani]
MLERNARRAAFVAGDTVTVFMEDAAFGVTRHREPAWKVVLGVGGPVEVGLGTGRSVIGAGVVVPPELEHTCAAEGAFAALFVDPWSLETDRCPAVLDENRVRWLLDALGPVMDGGADPDAAFAELTRVSGAGRGLDPRLEYAVRSSAGATDLPISSIAGEVGLSPVRLRALVGDAVGVPLVRLRRWARLRAAISALAHSSLAEAAAEAGFADQAHFTRTAGSLIGRTPGSLRGRSSGHAPKALPLRGR